MYEPFRPEFSRDPYPHYRRLRDETPVCFAPEANMWCVSRYEDVLWALRHPEIFSSEMEMHMQLGTERPMIPQQIDPPAQTRYRKLLDPTSRAGRWKSSRPPWRATRAS